MITVIVADFEHQSHVQLSLAERSVFSEAFESGQSHSDWVPNIEPYRI